MGQSSSSAQQPARQCPVDHPQPQQPRAQCPVPHDNDNDDSLNPANQMPALSQRPTPAQSAALPTDRELSSIPRDDASKWEYPSPQQFYNALVRKGWDTPEESVEPMVHIHNFLNEQAWNEILKWEHKQDPTHSPQLTRFKGRPGEISPKARLCLLAGWLLPSRFNTEPPFDRHDWVVRRPATGQEVRYVIDYYSAPPDPHSGQPVFSLDVRPAIDSLDSVGMRVRAATEQAWASLREGS